LVTELVIQALNHKRQSSRMLISKGSIRKR